MDALAELDERVAVEPDVRDVARRRLVEDRLGRRSERSPLGEPDEPLELGHEIERDLVVIRRDQVIDESDRDLAGFQPDRFLTELIDDVVAAVLSRGPRLAVANIGTGQVLELERDVLGDVASPGPLAQSRDEAAAPA